MPGNSFGKLFRLHTFGESHGAAIGGIIDGCPAGLEVDLEFIRGEMQRRRPGQSDLTTQRQEEDEVTFHSGIFEGVTTGTPIGFSIPNRDARSHDYSQIKDTYRPSHADYVYEQKYGRRDYRGGGRSSARETACRVVGGAIAQLLLKKQGIEIHSFVQQVGTISMVKELEEIDLPAIFSNEVRCPDKATADKMREAIEKVKAEGDSLGGCIQTLVKNCPVGLGEPVFNKLHADLGRAMLSINAVKGFEYGSGFCAAAMKGSDHNDRFVKEGNTIRTATNLSGGIQGGISNGELIYFRTAFKPVATLMQNQKTVDKEGREVELQGKGRHDPCVLPRAVPIVTAMTALVLADHWLRNQTAKL
jgi:chorismate synthase